MHTGYTLIQPYVFLTLNSLLTNEHLLSSPADLFCYEFSGDVSLKFVASPYTELIIGQRPDGSCRIFCIRTADEPLILKLSGFSYCFGVRFDESLYYRLPGHPFPFPADLLQTISMSDSDIFSGTVSFSERIQRFLSALNKTGKTPTCHDLENGDANFDGGGTERARLSSDGVEEEAEGGGVAGAVAQHGEGLAPHRLRAVLRVEGEQRAERRGSAGCAEQRAGHV